MKFLKIFFVFVFSFLLFNTSRAETNRFSIIHTRPLIGANDSIVVYGSDTFEQNDFAAGVHFEYGHRDLEVTDNGDRVQGVVDNIVVQHWAFTYALFNRVQVGIDLPLVLFSEFTSPDALPGVVTDEAEHVGDLGDLQINLRFKILDTAGWGLTVIPFMTLPTGDEDHYVGDNSVTGGAMLAFDKKIGEKWWVGLNAGFDGREEVNLFDLNTGFRFLSGFGIQFFPNEYWKLKADLSSFTPFEHFFENEVSTGLEAHGGVSYAIGNSGVSLDAAASFGILRAAGTPIYSLHYGVTYTHQKNSHKSSY